MHASGHAHFVTIFVEMIHSKHVVLLILKIIVYNIRTRLTYEKLFLLIAHAYSSFYTIIEPFRTFMYPI